MARFLDCAGLMLTLPMLGFSPAFLAEAVSRLDMVIEGVCYQDVTAPKALASGAAVSVGN